LELGRTTYLGSSSEIQSFGVFKILKKKERRMLQRESSSTDGTIRDEGDVIRRHKGRNFGKQIS
jgi:hypothetical protein